jgi:hypothetical protein
VMCRLISSQNRNRTLVGSAPSTRCCSRSRISAIRTLPIFESTPRPVPPKKSISALTPRSANPMRLKNGPQIKRE